MMVAASHRCAMAVNGQGGEYSRRGSFGAVEDVLRCFAKVAAREQKAVEGSEEEIEVALIGIVADGDNPGSC